MLSCKLYHIIFTLFLPFSLRWLHSTLLGHLNEQCWPQLSIIAPQEPPGRPVAQLSIHINISAQVRHVKATLNYLYQVNRHPAVKGKWLQLQSVGERAEWIESKRYIITVIVCERLLLCISFFMLFFFVCLCLDYKCVSVNAHTCAGMHVSVASAASG